MVDGEQGILVSLQGERAAILVRKTGKNQVILPKAIVQQLPDAEYFEVSVSDRAVILRPVVISTPGGRLKGVRAKIKALGLTEKDIEGAIRWAWRRPPGARSPRQKGIQHLAVGCVAPSAVLAE